MPPGRFRKDNRSEKTKFQATWAGGETRHELLVSRCRARQSGAERFWPLILSRLRFAQSVSATCRSTLHGSCSAVIRSRSVLARARCPSFPSDVARRLAAFRRAGSEPIRAATLHQVSAVEDNRRSVDLAPTGKRSDCGARSRASDWNRARMKPHSGLWRNRPCRVSTRKSKRLRRVSRLAPWRRITSRTVRSDSHKSRSCVIASSRTSEHAINSPCEPPDGIVASRSERRLSFADFRMERQIVVITQGRYSDGSVSSTQFRGRSIFPRPHRR